MQVLTAQLALLQLGIEYLINQVGVKTRDERGALSTEMAVLIAAFVAIAVAGGLIFMNKMASNANNIPDSVSPPAGPSGG